MARDKQQRDFDKRWRERGVSLRDIDKAKAECWYFMGRSDENARCLDNEFYTGKAFHDFTKEGVKRKRAQA
jgi:hypothetical protein